MKNLCSTFLGASIAAFTFGGSAAIASDDFTDALVGGKAKVDMNLRYETVEQDNDSEDATALTLRTRLTYLTKEFQGFSAVIEMEDSRIVGGQDEFTVGPTGFNPNQYSVIADPETTELDQAYLQYKNGMFVGKFGRQVITLDNHRFLGHVGWRQDRQTFDAANLTITPAEGWKASYIYIGQRNRIFAEAADLESKDHLFNVSYKTPVGTIVGYSYMLELDNDTDNARDTLGLRFTGATPVAEGVKLLYTLEFASQEYELGAAEFEADYTALELGVSASGFTGKIGYELLGSDDGNYVFETPLATLHKFNGWADLFIVNPQGRFPEGIVDTYLSASYAFNGGKGGNLTAVYHSFDSDEDRAAGDTLGTELDVVYGYKFNKHYSVGAKAAFYSADDFAVDTDKIWLWFNISF